jgi:dolichol kinase
LDQQIPRPGAHAVALKERWGELQVTLIPHYERLANSLSAFDIHVPALRPRNHFRSIWHALNGLLVVGLIQWVFTGPGDIFWAGLSFALLAWSMELSRRFFPGVNRLMMGLFKHVSHPHEEWRINSATWYCTAMLVLGVLGHPMAASIAAIVLGLADPAAAWVGRRWGQVPLLNGRTLEGSLTFMLVGTVATMAVVLFFYSQYEFATALTLGLVAGVIGAIAEVFCRRVDDNLGIPVTVGLSILGTLAIIGV